MHWGYVFINIKKLRHPHRWMGSLFLLIMLSLVVFAYYYSFLYCKTPCPDAVAEKNGVTITFTETPTRDMISYRIENGSQDALYTGTEDFALEYYFLGCWYRVRPHKNDTRTLDLSIIQSGASYIFQQDAAHYDKLPRGKYRLVQRFEMGELQNEAEKRDKSNYFILYIPFDYN